MRYPENRSGLAGFILLQLIRLYQSLSRYTPAICRFSPTCSEYAKQAIFRYGAARGGWYALRRVLRCHPWHSGGCDPVP